MSFFGLLLLAFGVIRINESLSFPSTWALIPVLGAVLVIASGSKAFLNRIFLMNPIAVWFGLISYPLYLWHWPILSFLQIVDGEMPHRDARISAVIVSILLAWFTYRIIELPVRRFGHWRLKTASLVALMLTVGLISLFIFETNGRLLPISPKQVVADTAKESPKRKDCHFPRKKDFDTRNFCTYFEGDKSVAVFGNSHSVELAYSIAQILKPFGMGIQHHTMSGCTHNVGLTNLNEKGQICADWQNSVIQKLKLDESVSSVVVSYRNETYLKNELLRYALVNMLDSLVRSNKQVILVLQAPVPNIHINSSIRKEVFSSTSSVRGRAKEDWSKIYSAKESLLKELPEEVKVFDPSDLFCDKRDCYVVKDGIALYFDDDHMSVRGAEMVAKEVVKLISLK